MTGSYLDEAWVEAQSTELQSLQTQLSEHLAVIAIASGQLPDLVRQFQRLGEREQEVHRVLEDLQAVGEEQLEGVAAASVALLEAHVLRLQEAMTGRAGEVEACQEAQATVLIEKLETYHRSLREQLHEQAQALITSLPSSVRAIEHLANELRATVEDRLLTITRETRIEAQAWTGAVASLKTDLRTGVSGLAERLKTQEQLTLAWLAARQEMEDRFSSDLKQVEKRLGEMAESDRRAAAHGLDAVKTDQEAMEQLLTELGGYLQRVKQVADGDRQAVSQALEEVKIRENTLEKRLVSALQEELGQMAQVIAENQGALEATLGASRREQEALESQRNTNLKTALAGVHQIADEDRRMFTQSLGSMSIEQDAVRAEHVALTEQVQGLVNEVTDARMEALRLREQLEASQAGARAVHAEADRRMSALAAQATERELLFREEIRHLRGALDEHGRQVRRSLDGMEKEQRDLESRFAATVIQKVTTVEAQIVKRHEGLGDQVEVVRREVGELRGELSKVDGRIAAFMGWFSRAGVWVRMNGKPEP